jgi:DNA-binding LytR/AlgR family response regulator
MSRPVYKDFWFKIIGCLVISELIDSIGREESIISRLGSKHFYYDLLSGFVMALLVWEVVRFLIIRLDRRYDWMQQPFKRIVLQLLFAIVLPAFLSFVLTMIYMKLAYNQDIFKSGWLNSEFYSVILFIILINLVYFTWWLYLNWKSQQELLNAPVVTNSTSNGGRAIIEVTRGNKKVLLPQQDIACAYLRNSYCYIKPFDGEAFVTSYSLDELTRTLDGNHFFRVNRQTLISRKSCSAYRSIEHGKIELEINPPLKDVVIVSQKRASEFRRWASSPALPS